MRRKNFGISFRGFEEMIEKYERLGGDVKEIVEDCLEVIPDMVNPNLRRDMARHRRTGDVENSIAENQRVQWEGMIAKIPVGFKLHAGGWASIYLMYGTARHAPANQYGRYSGTVRGVAKDTKLHDDIYGTSIKRKITDKQKTIFFDKIKQRMGQ